ncbi:MAG: PDZ domain-containing protein [Myxococcota bacterium]|nr:PDZ domain-containing protein [Myxococcota bacterium]
MLFRCRNRFPLALALLAVLVAGCAYPRRTTSLSPVRGVSASSASPSDVWSLTVAGAVIPPMSRGALAWDGSDGLPDPFVRIYRDEVLVWESETLSDTLAPAWNVTLPRNLYAPSNAMYRFELWDRDEVGADPIGIYRHRGLPPNVVPGADARVMMDSSAQLALRLEPPQAHHGLGIRLYEVRGDALVVLEVETHSPAGRAGIRAGEEIVGIGGQSVSALGSQRAPGALSMASDRRERLRVRNARGETREVELDAGHTWLTM